MKRAILAITLIALLLSACGGDLPTPTETPIPTETTVLTETPIPSATPLPTLAATETPQPSLTPTPQLADYDVFIKYMTNMYDYMYENLGNDMLQIRSIEFVENPDDDITLLVQVKGDITDSAKASTFATLASVIGGQLKDTPNKVPERLRLFVVEFFDSKENYHSNYGIKWSHLREQINNNFEGIRGVLRTDISGYKK